MIGKEVECDIGLAEVLSIRGDTFELLNFGGEPAIYYVKVEHISFRLITPIRTDELVVPCILVPWKSEVCHDIDIDYVLAKGIRSITIKGYG